MIFYDNILDSNVFVVIELFFEDVICLFKRDVYYFCEDIMGVKWLIVVLLMVGSIVLVVNFVVVIVMFISDCCLNVYCFLMSNLVFVDFCFGLYLIILVCVFLNILGEYYNYVRVWEYGVGCKIVGFIVVFFMELFVYIFIVIIIERFFVIVYVMEVNI